MSKLADQARFLSAFLRNPRTTGSLVPSSQALAKRMVEGIGLESAQTIVEIGPGTGPITAELLACKRTNTRLIAVELDPGFANSLATRFPGLEVVNESAESLPEILRQRNIGSADAVVCSLPWTNLPDDVTRRIMTAITDSLKPGGWFTSYVYLTGGWMPSAWRFRSLLRRSFASVERTPVVWTNAPPAFVCRCRKQESSTP